MKYHKLPLKFVERENFGQKAPWIEDADGRSVAMLMWPAHPPEEEDAAVEELYVIGRAMAEAIESDEAVMARAEDRLKMAYRRIKARHEPSCESLKHDPPEELFCNCSYREMVKQSA